MSSISPFVTWRLPENVFYDFSDLKSFDPCLGAYPYESLSKWVSLTNHIAEGLVSRIQPLSGRISSVTQVYPDCYVQPPNVSSTLAEGSDMPAASVGKDQVTTPPERGPAEGTLIEKEKGGEVTKKMPTEEDASAGDVEGDVMMDTFAGVGEFSSPSHPHTPPAQHQPKLKDLKMKQVKEAMLRLSAIPRQKYPDGATPSQISHHNMDLSFSMATMLAKEYNNEEKDLLGELQFSFVCFLVGHVYDAFEHWKELVKLACFSEEALATRTQFFLDFITVLHFQLKEIPEDFFVDIVSRSNFLTVTLQAFFSGLEEGRDRVDASLVKRGLQFRDNLTKKFKWDFSTEPDEFAPTVVDLT